MAIVVLLIAVIAGLASSAGAWAGGGGLGETLLAFSAGGLLAVMTMLAALLAIVRGQRISG